VARKLYVGNLPYSTDDSTLQNLFQSVGDVDSAKVIIDRETGRSKGFGFVEMASDDQAQQAISKLNGQSVDGRALTVSEARPQAPREPRSFDRGNSSSGGYGKQPRERNW